MTNKKLLERFFRGKAKFGEESYGFCVSYFFTLHKNKPVLFSKLGCTSLSVMESKNCALVATSDLAYLGSNWKNHVNLVVQVAEYLGLKIIRSPCTDKRRFQAHMEKKINKDLTNLAQYVHCHPRDKTFIFNPKYKLLMYDIRSLLEDEALLDLPKNQASLLDNGEVQDLWEWLIKKNPNKEDRKLLRKMYSVGRLLGKKNQPADSSVFWGPNSSEIAAFPTSK